MRNYDDMLDAAMHEHFDPDDRPMRDWDFPEFEDQGDAIDRAMDTKAEQDMLADDEYDDPEADAADALDAEADRMFAAYQRAHPVGPAPADQSLAYEPGDYKGKHALGWTNE